MYMKKLGRFRHWALSDQGQGHGDFKFCFHLPQYKCKVLYFSFDTMYEVTNVSLSDINIQHLLISSRLNELLETFQY